MFKSTQLISFAIFCLCLSLTGSAFSGELPSADECSKITILSPNGWTLRILNDGSGELTYGRMVQDTTRVKKGAFSFKEIYNSLSKVLQDSGDVLTSFTVLFEKTDKSVPSEFYAVDQDLIKGLFDKAKESVSFNTFFNNAWKNNPPGLPK